MKYFLIEKNPDTVQLLVAELAAYFHDGVQVKAVFPNFGTIRIGDTHPFAILNMALVNGVKEPGNLFPSVTIAMVEDALGPGVLNLEGNVIEITDEWLATQVNNPLIRNEQIQELRDFITTEGRNPFGIVSVDRFEQRVVFAVWTENNEVKNYLYKHLRSFIYTHQELFLSLEMENWTLSGTPYGLYNLDFGRILYGAELAMTATRSQANVFIDTSWISIEAVNMYIQSIKNIEGGG